MADTQAMALTSRSDVLHRASAGDHGASPRLSAGVDVASAVVVVLVFAWRVVPASGGREGSALTVGLASTVAAFVLIRAWRFLTPVTLMVLAAVPACALLVAVLMPSGGAGVRAVQSYAYAAATFAFVVAFARTPARRIAVVLAVCGLGVQQFAMALGPWLGGADASRRIVGTFYWHNQFGAYMLAASSAAVVLGTFGTRAARSAALVVAPVCAAMVLLSASRGSLLLLAALWAAVGFLVAVQATGRFWGLVRWGAMTIAVIGVVTALTSPVLFPGSGQSGTGVSAVRRREAEQDTGNNVGFRVAHNRAALAVFRAHPIAGVGFDGYRAAGPPFLARGIPGSPYVHNGFLQAAVDGGLLLAIPLLIALLAAMRGWLPFAMRRWRYLDRSPAEAAAIAASLVLLLHSAIDMDWIYPALVALLATTLAVAVAARDRAGSSQLIDRGRLNQSHACRRSSGLRP